MKFGSNRQKWHLWYAYRPVKTLTGEWVWLEWLERSSYFSKEVPCDSPHTIFGGWSFREILKTTCDKCGQKIKPRGKEV